MPRSRLLVPLPVASLLALAVATSASSASAQIDAAQVPTYTDAAQRGLRMRLDLGGRYLTVGEPDPAIRLEVDDRVQDRDDFDVSGMLLLGWDRPFGVPVVGDFMGDTGLDIGGDSPVSPFLDDQSAAPRARIYSAFIGLSGAPGEVLEMFKLNLGRMTELAESPVTYDGLSAGINYKIPKLGYVAGKIWGGVDAPQRLAQDPFTRIGPLNRAYSEKYVDDSGFISPTGGLEVERTNITDPILNLVGGLSVDGNIIGIGWQLKHTLLPTVQRSLLGVSYTLDHELLMANVGVEMRASDFLPRSANLKGDLLTWDGTTRIGANVGLQFLEDICAFDCTFRAFNPAEQLIKADADAIETFRVRDQIRHLNIGPAQEHISVFVDGERLLPFGLSALAHGRLRQHFDAADLDYFRTNVYELGGGVAWSTGLAMDIGDEVSAGLMDSGKNDIDGFDLIGEGVTSYVENRFYLRAVLLEGKLSNLAEVFVRRQDIQTKSLFGGGQWSGAVANTLRYDIFDFWSLALRVDGDALSPIDSLNGSTYLGAMIATSVKL